MLFRSTRQCFDMLCKGSPDPIAWTEQGVRSVHMSECSPGISMDTLKREVLFEAALLKGRARLHVCAFRWQAMWLPASEGEAHAPRIVPEQVSGPYLEDRPNLCKGAYTHRCGVMIWKAVVQICFILRCPAMCWRASAKVQFCTTGARSVL